MVEEVVADRGGDRQRGDRLGVGHVPARADGPRLAVRWEDAEDVVRVVLRDAVGDQPVSSEGGDVQRHHLRGEPLRQWRGACSSSSSGRRRTLHGGVGCSSGRAWHLFAFLLFLVVWGGLCRGIINHRVFMGRDLLCFRIYANFPLPLIL